MLKVENLSYRVKKQQILKDISLEIEHGSFTVAIGPNGAGKSSLLRHLSAELPCQSGTISLDDKPLGNYTPLELARRRAVLPQEHELVFPFIVEEVVSMGTYHVEEAVAADLVPSALAECEIGHLHQRYYHTLSGGEKQRVQLARCLAQLRSSAEQKQYLLLDEPIASLDLKHQYQLLKLAKTLSSQGLGVFAILHDLNLAHAFADFIAILNRGRLVQFGPAHAVLTETNIEEVFEVKARFVEHQEQRQLMTMAIG